MDTSSRIATVILLVLMIILSICPVIGASTFPADRSVSTNLVNDISRKSDNGDQSRVRAIDESFNGKTVRVASGDTLLVQLYERTIDQTWHFSGDEIFRVISDIVPEMYPARHSFRVRVSGTGDLRFTKIDRRDGFLIDTFKVRVVISQAGSANNSRRAHPLRMLLSMGPDVNVYH